MANHEVLEQRRLSASKCDSTKGQQGPLGSMLKGGCRMGKGRRSEMRGGRVNRGWNQNRGRG